MLSRLCSSYRIYRTAFLPTAAALSSSQRLCPGSGRDARAMATLETLVFDNRVLRKLPIDKNQENYCRSVPGACYSRVDPTPVKGPKLVAYSNEALSLLGLSPKEVDREEFMEYFGGCRVFPGSEPAAHCYCGHQFGYFSGQLGDGCALYLGEVINKEGQRWELQLKGSGKTPYSRSADGRKVLRSSIREFLCSEAMHHLGVPTTRAGSCVTSDSYVTRDVFYNGNNIDERCTIVSRIAPTFIRFGSFEIFKTVDRTTGRAGPSVGRVDILNQLLDHVTECFYPQVHSAHADDRTKRAAGFFQELCSLTGRLVALWQCVGFCHGVLNTDNMSIVGVTIDYGPFGFLDRYDPDHICNKSDDKSRYAYKKQPSICRWNLKKLAEALSPCMNEEDVKKGLDIYDKVFQENYLNKMRQKLGLLKVELSEDSDLLESFLEIMHKTGCDFTNGFRNLSRVDLTKLNDTRHMEQAVEDLVGQCCSPEELVKYFKPTASLNQLQMFLAVDQQSPGLLEQLGISSDYIQQEMKKFEEVQKLKELSPEEKRQTDHEAWTQWMSLYRKRLQQEVAGLTPAQLEQAQEERVQAMNSSNPKFVLRNHIAQKAIELAEKGDYSEVRRVLFLLKQPYSESVTVDELWMKKEEEQSAPAAATAATESSQGGSLDMYCSRPPDWALGLSVT